MRLFMRRAGALAIAALTTTAHAQNAGDPGLDRFRSLYTELIETDTSLSTGSCTLAAERMRARLLAAGYAPADVRLVVSPAFPRQGNLVAVLKGSAAAEPAILLLAHIDVVEAKRSDWQRDPFKLVEENGFFYARGAVDDKSMAAAFTDAMIRYREQGYRPRRTIKLALTCGEETDDVFNGVQYILKTEPALLKAGFAINEGNGGKGTLDEAGKRIQLGIQTGEKVYQDFSLVTTSPGGHSSRPGADNAITRLAAAMVKLGAYRFPVEIDDAKRLYFRRTGEIGGGPQKTQLAAIGAGTASDAQVEAVAAANPVWNAILRTTCVVTMVQAGHAPNALAQKASATVNCRILPGTSPAAVRDVLAKVIADPSVALSYASPPGPVSRPPPLTAAIVGPVERIGAEMFPDVPIVPTLSTGASDGRFLEQAGIPTYGISGLFTDPDGNGVHGLNERVRVQSLYDSRTFLYRLVRTYAGGGN